MKILIQILLCVFLASSGFCGNGGTWPTPGRRLHAASVFTPTITFGAIGTTANGTTSAAPAYPSGVTAGDTFFCLVTGRSNTANTAPTMPAGWTRLSGYEGGTGTWAADTGTRRVDVFRKDNAATGSESGTVTVSLAGSTNNTLQASIIRVSATSGSLVNANLVFGVDTTNDTSYSATATSNLDFVAGGLVVVTTAQNLDTGTQSSRSLAASGVGFGTLTSRVSNATTSGYDHRHIVETAEVSSGGVTTAPTYSYTISASGSGPTGFLLLTAVLDGVPDQFAFADVANADLSTQYTNVQQITGIATGIACSGSGGTVAACTGATEGTCGTFGSTSGTITNNQYVGARVTSSASDGTAVNNLVTCGGVSDTFTVTTAGGSSYPDIIFDWSCDSLTAERSAGDNSATAQAGASINTTTYYQGTGSCGIGGSYQRFDFVLNNDDVIDVDAGRIGMWVRVSTTGNSTLFNAEYGSSSNRIRLYMFGTNRIYYDYTAGGAGVTYTGSSDNAFTTGTWFFVEFAWNKGGTGDDFQLFVNGASVSTNDTATGTWSKASNGTFSIGDYEGNNAAFVIDRVRYSTDPTRDLYALRDTNL